METYALRHGFRTIDDVIRHFISLHRDSSELPSKVWNSLSAVINVAILTEAKAGYGDVYSVLKFIDLVKSMVNKQVNFDILVKGNMEPFRVVFGKQDPEFLQSVKLRSVSSLKYSGTECPDVFIAIPLSHALVGTRPEELFNTVECPRTIIRLAFEYSEVSFSNTGDKIINGIFISTPDPNPNPSASAIDATSGSVPYFGYSTYRHAKILYILYILSIIDVKESLNFIFIKEDVSIIDDLVRTLNTLARVLDQSELGCIRRLGDLVKLRKIEAEAEAEADDLTARTIIHSPRLMDIPTLTSDSKDKGGCPIYRKEAPGNYPVSRFSKIIRNLSRFREIRIRGQASTSTSTSTYGYANPNSSLTLDIHVFGSVHNSDMQYMISKSNSLVLTTGDQSLFETISHGKVPFYETHPWKCSLVNGLEARVGQPLLTVQAKAIFDIDMVLGELGYLPSVDLVKYQAAWKSFWAKRNDYDIARHIPGIFDGIQSDGASNSWKAAFINIPVTLNEESMEIELETDISEIRDKNKRAIQIWQNILDSII